MEAVAVALAVSCLLMRFFSSSLLSLFRGLSSKEDLPVSGEAARAAEARREERRTK